MAASAGQSDRSAMRNSAKHNTSMAIHHRNPDHWNGSTRPPPSHQKPCQSAHLLARRQTAAPTDGPAPQATWQTQTRHRRTQHASEPPNRLPHWHAPPLLTPRRTVRINAQGDALSVRQDRRTRLRPGDQGQQIRQGRRTP